LLPRRTGPQLPHLSRALVRRVIIDVSALYTFVLSSTKEAEAARSLLQGLLCLLHHIDISDLPMG
jgi:hypothetical protein